MKRTLLIVAACLAVAPAITDAANPPQTPRHVALKGATAIVPVKVYPEFQSVFQFPERVVDTFVGNPESYSARYQNNTVMLESKSQALPTTLYVETHTLRVTLVIEMASSLSEAEPLVVFEHPSVTSSAPTADPPSCLPENDTGFAGFDGQGLTREQFATKSLLGFASTIRTADGGLQRTWEDGNAKWRFALTAVNYGDPKGVMQLKATNEGRYSFPLAAVEILDGAGTDHAEQVEIIGREVAGPVDSGDTLVITALFNEPAHLQGNMRIRLVSTTGQAAVLEAFEIRKEHLNKGRNTVLAWAGAGGMQLSRGDDGALVGAWGLGAQYVYGVSAHWSADIGASWLSSGEAEIAGVTQSETLYRVHGGLRYLFREEGWIPFARVGIGGALVSLSENGDSSFEARGFLQAGAGVARYLGDVFVIGVKAALEFYQGGGSFFTANAHVGFAWGGNEVQ